jgi:hypothetical protein
MRKTGSMPFVRNLPRCISAVLVVLAASALSVVSVQEISASASGARTTAPVLGAKGYGAPSATGWGTYKPKEFFNGGDPSGQVFAIAWKHWGHKMATGTGRGYIFKPSGGYYQGSVRIELRALNLGHCSSTGPLAYRRLQVRSPSRPGGPLGGWMLWSGSRSICGSSSKSTTTTTPAAAVPACGNGQIGVSVGDGGAGAGHEDQVLVFTNQSASTCSLFGYPGVAGLNAQGEQVVQAQRTPGGYLGGLESGGAPAVVPLAPGQAASAIVEGTDVPVGTATSCPDYPALLVTPPNLTDSVQVAAGLPGCSPIEVHPVVPGTNGSAS